MSLQIAKRTGLLAKKVGMSQIFDESGNAMAVTLLQADSNVVVATRTHEKDGYNAVILGFGHKKPSRVAKAQRVQFSKAGLGVSEKVREFRVTDDCMLNVGDQISLNHFLVGQQIDIHGVNTGKGFAGAMKRHNFRGLEASHGVSISHRSHGSTGNRQDPGRTFPGKKMAGHLGAESITIQNVKVVAIDEELGIIAVKGSVPGKPGSFVSICDAIKIVQPSELSYPAKLVEVKSAQNNDAAVVSEQPSDGADSSTEA